MSRLHVTAWVLNGALLALILVYSISRFQVATQIFPPNAIMPDGGKYYGDIENGLFHGNGKYLYGSGDSYEGEFKHGLFSGKGKFTSVTGDIFEGEFAGGYLSGQGHAMFTEGSEYTGEFDFFSFNGEGELHFPEGGNYIGQFKNHSFDGMGKLTTLDNQTFEGTFEKGYLKNGTHHDAFGNHYEGEFQFNNYHGEGSLTYTGGVQYIGTFENGNLAGKAKHISPDGTTYEGEFQDFLYHGYGVYKAPNTEYTGYFEFGTYHGEGELTYLDSNGETHVQKGLFEYGYLKNSDQNASEEVEETQQFTAENVLYNQNELIVKTRDAIQNNDPNTAELYFLGIAGDGSQHVFIKEVEEIQGYISERYDITGKKAILANHINKTDEYPLVTLHSLKHTLNAYAEKMDTENDILFLYLTSHGSAEHDLYINDVRIQLSDISAEQLAQAVNQTGIKHRIILISACYSGGFIEHLKNDTTLVMASAREDRQSFGCSSTSDMTYFGKALFREANPNLAALPQAFEQAKNVIEQWEKDEELEPHSEPQIFVGKAIQEYLQGAFKGIGAGE